MKSTNEMILVGSMLGIMFALLTMVTVMAYPLKIDTNGSYYEVNESINGTPLYAYYVNGSIYLVPANITTNITNVFYNITNITNVNVTNVNYTTNLTCINCTQQYNVTNVTHIYNVTNTTNCINCTVINNSINYDSNISYLLSRVNSIDTGLGNLEVKLLNLNNNFSLTNLNMSNSTYIGKWETRDTWFTIGIIVSILASLFAIAVIVRANQ